MRLTRWAVFASLWLLAVGLVGTAAWYAIDSAGRSTQVLASSDRARLASRSASSPVSGDLTPGPAPTSADDPTSGPDDPSASQSPDDPTSTGGSSSQTVPPSAPSTKPAPGRSQSPAARPGPRTSSSSSSLAAPQADSQLVKTGGGSVTITCRDGAQIDFTVRPAQGWRGDANQQGAQEADIKFSDSTEVWEVHAKCVSGSPQSTVDHKQHDD